MAIAPSDEQIAALIEKDQGGPINMLNLLKFKEFAEYPDGSDVQLSGKDAYMRYGRKVAEQVINLGGEFLFMNNANTLVIGDGELQWDMVGLVKYPSVAAFIEMTGSGEFDEIHVHREAGLAHQLLVQC
ncbi:MAG: hypothetical protein ACJAUG_003180 [Halioglobus sp.]|jgi:uncharacterized protein (DUF1330 family)